MASAVAALLAVVAAYVLGLRRGRRESQRENARLTARLATFKGIFRTLPASLRLGHRGVRLSQQDLATLALLVQHDGPEGEELIRLEAEFHPR